MLIESNNFKDKMEEEIEKANEASLEKYNKIKREKEISRLKLDQEKQEQIDKLQIKLDKVLKEKDDCEADLEKENREIEEIESKIK